MSETRILAISVRRISEAVRDRSLRHGFLCLALAAAAAMWAGFFALDARTAGMWIRHGGYAVTACVFAGWCWALAREWAVGGGSGRISAREWIQASALIGGLLLVAVFTAPYAYKVLYDEHVLQSTAWNLHMEREVGSLGRAYVVDGLLRSIDIYLDKRPVLFPFLVSLVHDATGYREGNAFALNTALFPVVLGLVYVVGRRLGGHLAGLAAAAGLGAFSLLALNATGAGMEMANLAFVLILAWAGARYLERPDERSLSLLALTGVLLAYTRYESALYVGSTGGLILLGWWRAGRALLPPVLLVTPLLLIPSAWHNTYLSGTPMLWELRDGYEARFSFDYLRANLAFAVDYFFAAGGLVANSLWLSVAGGLAGLVCVFHALRSLLRRESFSPAAAAVGCCALGAFGNMALLMAYYWGDLSDPIVSRLSLPFHAMLALAIAAVLGRVPQGRRERLARWSVAGALLVYLGVHLPVNQRLTELNTVETALGLERELLAKRGEGNRLIATDKSPLAWFIQGSSSTTVRRLEMRREGVEFHLRQGTFDEIIVTQTLRPLGAEGGFAVMPDDRLPPEFVLEPLAEWRIGARLQRVSRLREIKVDASDAARVSSSLVP